MSCHADRHLLTTWIFESALQPLIPYGAGHAEEIQIVKHHYVRHAGFANGVLAHVPARWPDKRVCTSKSSGESTTTAA